MVLTICVKSIAEKKLMLLSAHGKTWEAQKCRPSRVGNDVKNTKNQQKTRIIIGSVKRGSAPNDKKDTEFHMADVLSKLIGWFPAIPSMMTDLLRGVEDRYIELRYIELWFYINS